MNKRIIRDFYLPIFSAIVFVVNGCSFNYGGETDGLPEVPAIVINNPRFVRIEQGVKSVQMSAQCIEMYPKSKCWYAEELSFTGYKKDGTADASGGATLLFANLDTKEFVFAGGVSVELAEDELSIESGSLYWNEDQRLLSGDVSERVTIRKTDGTELSGVGFQADGLSREFFFARNIAGTITSGSDNE